MFDGLLAAHLFRSVVFADEYFMFRQIEYLSARIYVTEVVARNQKMTMGLITCLGMGDISLW